jgi:hypothetical protein
VPGAGPHVNGANSVTAAILLDILYREPPPGEV